MDRSALLPEDVRLTQARPADGDRLLPLVRAYHDFEDIDLGDPERRQAIVPLLQPASPLGRVWLIDRGASTVGYLAVCYGYSIEFAGRDGFVDELYIVPAARGLGIGRAVLEYVAEEERRAGVRALHLEVASENERARRLYRKAGFAGREQFHLMSRRL